jgi:hypothetical protein
MVTSTRREIRRKLGGAVAEPAVELRLLLELLAAQARDGDEAGLDLG